MDKEQHDIIIYSSPDGKINVSLMTRDGKIWLNQSQISDLFGTSVPNISYHISNILKEKELDANSVIKDYLITASDGKSYKTDVADTEQLFRIIQSVPSPKAEPIKQWIAQPITNFGPFWDLGAQCVLSHHKYTERQRVGREFSY